MEKALVRIILNSLVALAMMLVAARAFAAPAHARNLLSCEGAVSAGNYSELATLTARLQKDNSLSGIRYESKYELDETVVNSSLVDHATADKYFRYKISIPKSRSLYYLTLPKGAASQKQFQARIDRMGNTPKKPVILSCNLRAPKPKTDFFGI